jgi:deoxyribose-phosphate aldolase
MNSAELDALVERIGDEILARLGPASSQTFPALPSGDWPRPAGGYAQAIEWAIVEPTPAPAEVSSACVEAVEMGLAAVWVPVSAAARAVGALAGSKTVAGAVVDFPSGAASTPGRLTDLETALRLGAGAAAVTLNSGRIRAGDWDGLHAELAACAASCRSAEAGLAVILSPDGLSADEFVRAGAVARLAGVTAVRVFSSEAGTLIRAVAALAGALGGESELGAVLPSGAQSFAAAAACVSAGARRAVATRPAVVLAGAPAG